jgi:NAD(P)-dependent dehydrogenase (short-subunit alcohol dehydrogenase family)
MITGGSGGIGSDVARRLIARGDRVVLIARDEAKLHAVADTLGASATVMTCDALDLPGMQAVVERIETEIGAIDGLVHAVGSIVLRPLHALSLDEWRTTLDLNATSAFIAVKSVVTKLMRRRSGSVVLFSTVAAQTGLQNHEAIAAAKSAVEGLVRSAAISYARYGVRFNAVAPALTKTELSKSLWANEAMLAASVAMHPLGRVGEPSDIGAAAAYLLSDDASWVTGQILGVDGGLGAGVQAQKMTVGG